MSDVALSARGRHRTVILTVLLVSTLLLVGACASPDDGSPFEVVIELQADASAPVGFGATPGEALVRTEVELELSGEAHPVAQSLTRTTDGSGRITVMAESGLLEVFVRAATPDPLCGWIGGGSVTVSGGRATLTLDDLWVACE